MTHEELRRRPAYITANIQMELYDKVRQYLEENKLSQANFAKQLGVSKGYVSQILNGDFDHRVSKLVELSTKIGYIPNVIFEPMDQGLYDYSCRIEQTIHRLSETIGCTAFLAYRKYVEKPMSVLEQRGTNNKASSAA